MRLKLSMDEQSNCPETAITPGVWRYVCDYPSTDQFLRLWEPTAATVKTGEGHGST